MTSAARRRAVVVGLDGVPASYLEERVAAGTMPALAELLRGGRLVAMDSSVPPVSGVAWTGLSTGVNPGRHGIFGFTELWPGTYDLRFPNAANRLAPPVWEQLAELGGRSVVLNVPGTYPALAPAGSLLVSGFVSPRFTRSVSPPGWFPRVEELGYRTDVDVDLDWTDPKAVTAELLDLTEARRRLWWAAWEQVDWSLFWGVFTETDRFHHYHWGRRGEPWVGDLLDRLYRALDDHLADVADRLTDGDALFIVSDHGFGPIRAEVHLNHWLAEAGFLRFEVDRPSSLADIGPGTVAFALDPGRIYLHRKGRYPLGAVAPGDEAAVLEDVTAALAALTDPDRGEPALGRVIPGRDAFSGPALVDGPDLTVLPGPGFDPKGMVGAGRVFTRSNLTGMHSFADAVCFARGAGLPDRCRLEDVGASVLAWLGGDPSDLDGEPVLLGGGDRA
ncbi:MAG TPA: alkaline phosphatase family protein [Acidimicrobiia bacterium]|nr:alkaline phosphatase family protein [Acidimicrobiia bacterium]